MSAADSPPGQLLILTTSQTPLPVRYRHPYKPRLVIPPLVHRSLHNALDLDPPSFASSASSITIPHPDTIAKHDEPATSSETDSELTVKVHLVQDASPSERARWVKESTDLLATHKGLVNTDNLLVGWKGVDYKGKKTAVSEFFGCGAEGMEGGSGIENVDPAVEDHVAEVWDALRPLCVRGGSKDGAKRLGTLYLPLGVLKRLKASSLAPEINMLDTPDCHHLPHEYSDFAKENDIELWAGGGGEGSDPLPAAELHNLLQEFASKLQLPSQTAIPLRADQLKYDDTCKPAVAIRWVLAYSLVSKTRNVVKDKGYIISAELHGK